MMNDINWKIRAQELVDQHWHYHDVILPVFIKADSKEFWQAKKNWGIWYRQIGLHFYKHAIEDIRSGKIKI